MEFVGRLRRLARRKGLTFRFETSRGRGSNGMAYMGETGRATVKTGEIGKRLLAAMCKQLGIDAREP